MIARRLRVAAFGIALCAAGVAAAAPAQAQLSSWPQEAPPRPLPAREMKFPPYEVRSLSNGMQVVAVLHHEQPAVTMRLLVRAGAAQDPQNKGGIASLAASLLDQGTTTRSAQQIADQIDSIGGALGTGSGTDLTFANTVVMKDSFGLAADLLADVVRNPAFAADEIDRQKQQAISSLQVNSNDPDYVASSLFDRLVYGFHPYGLPGSGTPESLASITRDDLVAFHRQYFVPNNMILAIVGDVTSEEAFSTAERVFGKWPRAEVPAWKPIEPPQPTRRIIIVDKPDAVQTEIRVGQLAIPRKHDDYFAWDLAVKILGGEGANRLHRVLRSERGLTYGASADAQAMKQAGDFVAETDTRTETTGEALRLMVEEFSKLQRQRVFERELSDAQAYLAGSFPLTIETPNDIATLILNALFYETPVEDITRFRERVLSVTPDDIQRVAKQYIRPDRLSIVLVGNAAAFTPQLRGLGFTEMDIIPIAQLDLMSPTLRKDPERVVAAPAVPGFRRTSPAAFLPPQVNPGAAGAALPNDKVAMDLLRRAIEAKGGLEALKSVRTVLADAETVLQLPQGPVSSTSRTYVLYPDKFRVDADVSGAQLVQIYNAGNAWVKDPAGTREAPPPMRAEFSASVRRDTIPLLIGASEGRFTVRTLPDEKGPSGTAVKVLEASGVDLQPVRLYLDANNVIVGQAYSTPGANNRPVLTEEVFSDYRTINGVRVPFQAQLLQNGRPVLKRTLKSVVLNGPDVTAALFARPE